MAGDEAAGFSLTCQGAFTGLPTVERYGGWGPVPASALASYAFDLHNSGMAMASMWHANIGYVASWNAANGTASGAGATIKAIGGGWYRCFLAKAQPQDNIAIRIKLGSMVSQA